jgi:hypothetical protein
MTEKLKKSISKSEEKIAENEALSVIAEFLPDPIRDTLSGRDALRIAGQHLY